MGAALDTMKKWFSGLPPELLAEDVQWHVPGYPVPRETYVGRCAVFDEFFPALRSHFAAWGSKTDEMFESGDRVTVIGAYRATTKAGKAIEIPFIHVWTVRDGRIVRVVAAAQTALFAEVLGAEYAKVRNAA